MYFSHSRVFVQTAFFCHFVFHFLFSNAFQRDNNSDTVYVTGYIYIYIYVFGPFRGHFNPELGTKRVCAYEKIKDFVLISKTVFH